MISIQSIMLVALGFLAAALIALLIAPTFWARAVRLTTRRLKARLPLTEAEIKADKDRLRAEYAIRVHKLEMKVEQADLQRARHLIDINRRDGSISTLEREVVALRSNLEEHQNARRVLEQTVADRLPRVEHRLNEAKSLLFNRDREIAELTQSTRRQQLAIEEAGAINSQQTAEVERLSTALTTRGRNRQQLADPKFEGELALRTEIEALRAKTREQAALVSRLQSQLGHGSVNSIYRNGSGEPAIALPAAAESANAAANGAPEGDARPGLEKEFAQLTAKSQDQAAEVARLTAELATFRGGEGDLSGIKDSKIALKARLRAAEAQAEQHGDTIRRLRADLAATNERLALQGAHYMEQMRRLGVGTLPASGQSRRPVTQGQRLTVAERVAQSRGARPQPVPAAMNGVAAKLAGNGAANGAAAARPAAKATNGHAAPDAGLAVIAEAPADDLNPATDLNTASPAAAATAVLAALAASDPAAAPAASGDAEPGRPRLIDRIASLNKS